MSLALAAVPAHRSMSLSTSLLDMAKATSQGEDYLNAMTAWNSKIQGLKVVNTGNIKLAFISLLAWPGKSSRSNGGVPGDLTFSSASNVPFCKSTLMCMYSQGCSIY